MGKALSLFWRLDTCQGPTNYISIIICTVHLASPPSVFDFVCLWVFQVRCSGLFWLLHIVSLFRTTGSLKLGQVTIFSTFPLYSGGLLPGVKWLVHPCEWIEWVQTDCVNAACAVFVRVQFITKLIAAIWFKWVLETRLSHSQSLIVTHIAWLWALFPIPMVHIFIN